MSLLRAMMAQSAGGPPPGPGAHAYWRVLITECQASNYVSLAEVEFRATPSGADQASGGTAIATAFYGGGYEADKAFDNSNATTWAGDGTLPEGIGYHFAAPVEVQQVLIRATGAAYGDVGMVEAPKDIEIQWSDNGTTWTTVATYLDEPAWATGSGRLFAVPTSGAGVGAGQLPNNYTGLTFWYDSDSSPHYGQIEGRDTVTANSDGDQVYRFDSLGGINRVFYGSNPNSKRVVPVYGSSKGYRAGPIIPPTGDSPLVGNAKPAAGAAMGGAITIGNFITGSNAVVIMLLKPISLPADSGNPYSNTGLFKDTGYGWMALACFNDGGAVRYQAYGYDSGGNDIVNSSTTHPFNEWHVVTYVHRSGRLIIRVNGVERGNIAHGTQSTMTQSALVWAQEAGPAEAHIRAFATYNQGRTNGEILEVEKYFGSMVGLSI